jgi:hypothetical protein
MVGQDIEVSRDMPRKPVELIQVNLRIREGLRRKLAREAERRRWSLNNEMRWRLEASLEQAAVRDLDDVATDMKANWERYAERLLCLSLEEQLAKALAQGDFDKAKPLAQAWLNTRRTARQEDKP